MAELLWSAAGILIAGFLLYFLAHAWVIRPLIERVAPGFPFLDSVLGGHPGKMSRREYREWYREYYGEDPD